MKIQDIPSFMGRSAAALAADFGIPKQTIGQYLNGQRGKPSKLISDLLVFCNLNREEIIFPDRFDHPDGENPQHAAYWANVALEALEQAVNCGFPESHAELIAAEIGRAVKPLIAD